MKILGIVLIVVGFFGLSYGGIGWTRQDKVLDVGPVQVTRDKTERLPLPPMAAGLCLAAGLVMLLSPRGSFRV